MYEIYTDDNLSHYFIMNKESYMNIDYLNVYIIFYISIIVFLNSKNDFILIKLNLVFLIIIIIHLNYILLKMFIL